MSYAVPGRTVPPICPDCPLHLGATFQFMVVGAGSDINLSGADLFNQPINTVVDRGIQTNFFFGIKGVVPLN